MPANILIVAETALQDSVAMSPSFCSHERVEMALLLICSVFFPWSIFTSISALNESDCVILIPNMREISQFNPWEMDLNGFKGECTRAETFRALPAHRCFSAPSSVFSRVVRMYKPERLCLNVFSTLKFIRKAYQNCRTIESHEKKV